MVSDAGCDSTGLSQVNGLCAATAILLPNTPIGGACNADSDCIAVDAGPVSRYETGPGCQINYALDWCAGTCSLGSQAGSACSCTELGASSTLCYNPNFLTCGAGQGTCQFAALPGDAGFAELCQAFVADGGPCADVYESIACDGVTEYCADAGLPTLICQPVAASGSACDPTACAHAAAQCSCGALACIPTVDAHTGACGPVDLDTPCVQRGVGSCGSQITCRAGGPAFLGDAGGLCLTDGRPIGAPCDLTDSCGWGVCGLSGTCELAGGEGDLCYSRTQCVPPLNCFLPSDGGYEGVCAPNGAPAGARCPSLAPFDGFSLVFCTAFDFCSIFTDGGGVCLPQIAMGAPCDPNLDNPYSPICLEGYCGAVEDGGAVCRVGLEPGESCNGFSALACVGGECHAQSDGGSICDRVNCGN